jgi:hypothetical protein
VSDDRLMQILQALAVLLFVVGPRAICLGEMGEMGLDRDLFRGGRGRADPELALGAQSGFVVKESPMIGS